jgi:hypothetical protein
MSELKSLAIKLDLEYIEAKGKYDLEVELLRLKREQFYRENPDFPDPYMYMQVTAPPQRLIIREI